MGREHIMKKRKYKKMILGVALGAVLGAVLILVTVDTLHQIHVSRQQVIADEIQAHLALITKLRDEFEDGDREIKLTMLASLDEAYNKYLWASNRRLQEVISLYKSSLDAMQDWFIEDYNRRIIEIVTSDYAQEEYVDGYYATIDTITNLHEVWVLINGERSITLTSKGWHDYSATIKRHQESYYLTLYGLALGTIQTMDIRDEAKEIGVEALSELKQDYEHVNLYILQSALETAKDAAYGKHNEIVETEQLEAEGIIYEAEESGLANET